MKLSEAIRVGAMIRPQARGTFQRTLQRSLIDRLLGRKPVKTSCAWRAALEAQGCGTREEKVTEYSVLLRDGHSKMPPIGSPILVPDVPDEWLEVTSQRATCPQCYSQDFVIRLITHLNDDHAWPREAIAIWVEQIEGSTRATFITPSPQQVDDDVLNAAEVE